MSKMGQYVFELQEQEDPSEELKAIAPYDVEAPAVEVKTPNEDETLPFKTGEQNGLYRI